MNRKSKNLDDPNEKWHFCLQVNVWRYGDFTDDDAKEFGFSRWAQLLPQASPTQVTSSYPICSSPAVHSNTSES